MPRSTGFVVELTACCHVELTDRCINISRWVMGLVPWSLAYRAAMRSQHISAAAHAAGCMVQERRRAGHGCMSRAQGAGLWQGYPLPKKLRTVARIICGHHKRDKFYLIDYTRHDPRTNPPYPKTYAQNSPEPFNSPSSTWSHNQVCGANVRPTFGKPRAQPQSHRRSLQDSQRGNRRNCVATAQGPYSNIRGRPPPLGVPAIIGR